ncbi:MAG: hypothetical protein ACTS3R_06320 [Inquilinaceae bacterium]
MKPILRAMGLALTVAVAAGASAHAADATVRGACRADIEAALAALGIEGADVSRITTYVHHSRFGSDDDERIAGYQTWVRLNRCETGHVVMEHSSFCDVRQIYTRGACQVEGLRNYH